MIEYIAPLVLIAVLEIVYIYKLKESMIITFLKASVEVIIKIAKEIAGEKGDFFCGLTLALMFTPAIIMIINCFFSIISDHGEFNKNFNKLISVILVSLPLLLLLYHANIKLFPSRE